MRGGHIDVGDLTSSELGARRLPEAHVVKAFNTVYYETLRMESSRTDRHRLVFFITGNDEEAKALVSRLIEEIGSEPVDTGSLG